MFEKFFAMIRRQYDDRIGQDVRIRNVVNQLSDPVIGVRDSAVIQSPSMFEQGGVLAIQHVNLV